MPLFEEICNNPHNYYYSLFGLGCLTAIYQE